MSIWYPAPNRPKNWRRMSYNDKTLFRLKQNSIRSDKTNCLLWQGGISSGYGQISYYNKTTLVHRLAMHILRDFDLDSKDNINHIRECPNSNCWEIEHLYIGNQQDNMDDREANTTHCPQGHEYTTYNTYLWHDKKAHKYRKNCRACHNEREKNR